ncbi:hypothetical protein CRV01_01720 [Arcobacter sp. CECT 8983]|uniref:DUF4810 domain-containing protein n=1 Tax=Arcobacter sp. CECT 8983 TaxID=2044508 RepID=UPI00100A7832|nr:DUF4810 domain-containing protein [Arcobacter sp. CECT 8983]RXJ91836.1 hypothetical protein CRV01_01720 [Arcobacter sp. CECT 8983]
MTFKNIFLIILLTLFFIGCGANKQIPPIYTWNNYVESSSEYGVKGHEKEVFEKHVAELQKIILDSKEQHKRVAPGIYAELGQLLYQSGKKAKAKEYFILEKTTYSESTVFMDRVIAKLYGEEK